MKTVYNILLIAVLLFLMGCPGGKDDGINWTNRPHQDVVPQPFGAWTKAPTFAINTTKIFYTPDNNNTSLPPETLGIVQKLTPILVQRWEEFGKAQGFNFTYTNDIQNADICIQFYHSRYITADDNIRIISSTKNIIQLEDILKIPTKLILEEEGTKSTSSMIGRNIPPETPTEYNGVNNTKLSHGIIKQQTIYVNTMAYSSFLESKRILKEVGQEYDAEAVFASYLSKVVTHELGHSWGLSDSIGYPGEKWGLMVYRFLQDFPNNEESATVHFIYGK